MVKKIQCRVIASAVPDNRNAAKNEICTASNSAVNNRYKYPTAKKLTYTNRSGTVKANYDNSHGGGLLDLFF